MKYWLAALALVLLSIGSSGCRKTQASELTGTWVLNSGSRGRIPTPLRQCSPRVILNPDGTFQAFELPGYFSTDELPAKLDSGKGTWTLRNMEGGEVIQLNFDSITSGSTELPVPYGNQLWISRWPSVSLDYSVGGPDTGLRMEFERQR